MDWSCELSHVTMRPKDFIPSSTLLIQIGTIHRIRKVLPTVWIVASGSTDMEHAGDSAKTGELDAKRITSPNIIGRTKRSLVNLDIETLLLRNRNTSVPGLKHIEGLVVMATL